MNPEQIKQIQQLGQLQKAYKGTQQKTEGQKGFKDIMTDMLGQVNQLQVDADESIKKLAAGEVRNIHEVMIAVEEANLAFDMVMQMKNKVVEAYKEIERMPI